MNFRLIPPAIREVISRTYRELTIWMASTITYREWVSWNEFGVDTSRWNGSLISHFDVPRVFIELVDCSTTKIIRFVLGVFECLIEFGESHEMRETNDCCYRRLRDAKGSRWEIDGSNYRIAFRISTGRWCIPRWILQKSRKASRREKSHCFRHVKNFERR